MKLPIQRKENQLANNEMGIVSMQDMMDRFFDDSFWSPFDLMHRISPTTMRGRAGWMPRIDVSETEREIRVKVNAPNVDPSQVNVSLEDDMLTISGKTEDTNEEKGETFYRIEREYGAFQRSIQLPSGADTEKIEAIAKNGVIQVLIPKKPESQKKSITVQVQDQGK